jgi:hypothetical protein
MLAYLVLRPHFDLQVQVDDGLVHLGRRVALTAVAAAMLGLIRLITVVALTLVLRRRRGRVVPLRYRTAVPSSTRSTWL